jgi:hypothetical protein
LADDATHLCDGPLMSKPYSHGALETRIKRLLGSFGRTTG